MRRLRGGHLLRRAGDHKVLDFGLAKAVEDVGGRQGAVGRESPSMAPTLTTPAMTQAGVLLGTAARGSYSHSTVEGEL